MTTVDEARALVLEATRQNEAVRLPVDQSVGCVLAEDVTSDVNAPPHDKSLVDGYAIIAADLCGPETDLTVVEEIFAGMPPKRFLQSGNAARIMTGAVLPEGADAVVMLEQTTTLEDSNADMVRVNLRSLNVGQNIMRCGTLIHRDEVVLSSDRRLRPTDVGLLAEVGRSDVQVIRPPRVAIIATGNELVPASQQPPAAHIRNSNGPMLAALARTTGSQVIDFGICSDQIDTLTKQIELALGYDVLILSGGVSVGVLDLIPQVCAQLGLRQVFHKVRLKPGKPVWFGVDEQRSPRTLVFGLPGNPLGCLVCFELFVRLALTKMAGCSSDVVPRQGQARLACDHHHRSDRPTYAPGCVEPDGRGGMYVTPIAWHGSSDQRSLAMSNCLVFLPHGSLNYERGTPVNVLFLDVEPGATLGSTPAAE